MKDLVAATTDGGKNVLRAVELLGLRKQQCFIHGLDLVVRRVTYGAKASSFNADMISAFSREVDEEVDSDGDSDEESEPESVTLGEVVTRLRDTCRYFKKRPRMMDEIRNVTQRDEYNGKRLKVILDCRTRWYSTLLMIEMSLLILPALNNVLSRHGTPISARDAEALENIASVLKPFKRAILSLCEAKATLRVADKVFIILLENLRNKDSSLEELLYEKLLHEIAKRRTILSSVLALLDNPKYDFWLEREIGVCEPSDQQMVSILTELNDLSPGDVPSVASGEEECRVSHLFFALFQSFPSLNDSVLLYIVLMTSPLQRTITWESLFDEDQTDPGASSSDQTCSGDDLGKQFELYRANGVRSTALQKMSRDSTGHTAVISAG